MTNPFDNWSKPLGQVEDARLSSMIPFGQYTQQQGQGDYQSVPQSTQQTAKATRAGTLAMNKQSSYLSYLDQVVGGTLPGDEGAKRAGYIPMNEGTAGYSGSGYVDRNVKMAPNAIPSAYQYANIAKNSNPYGINQLIWGGPASGKTSNPLDYVPYATLTGLKGDANSFLESALIPDNLAGDVSNRLYGKWMQNWGGKFDQMATDRAAQQGAWWGGSDWANKSINPARNEVISPAVAGTDAVPYQAAVYDDVPASRVLVRPEVQASSGRPYQAAVYRDVPAQHNLVTPEVQATAGTPYRAAVYQDVAAQHNLVTPEQQAIAAGYYTPIQAEYNDWVAQQMPKLESDIWTQTKNGQTAQFSGSQADAWQDEFARNTQNLYDVYPFWQNRYGAFNLDPASPNNAFYRNEQAYGGQGKLVNNFTDETGFDMFGNPFNSDLGYTAFGDPTQSLTINNVFPALWGNQTPGQDYRAAVYEDIPSQHNLVSPEVQAIPGRQHQDAVYEDIPASRYEVTSEQQAIAPTDYQAAVYREIAAQHNLVTPERFARPAVPGSPEIDFYHPQSRKAGFDTVLDPITGVAIPNWYLNGAFGSNPELQSAYGNPGWFVR